jgi:ribosomal-protein-alanine N-acetyltransferase
MALIQSSHVTINSCLRIEIRSCRVGDEQSFLEFLARIPQDSNHTNQYVGKALPSLDEAKARIEKNINDPVTLDIGAFDGSKLIGFLNFRLPCPDHPWQAHLGRFGLMILREYWGLGLGRKLLDTYEPYAIKSGIKKVEAEVRVTNNRGVTLYKKAGYQIEGRRRHAVRIDGEWGDEFFIAKFLGEDPPLGDLPTLETNRLILRPLAESDAANIYAYAKNPNVSKYTLWEPHRSIDDSLDYITNYAFGYYKEGIPEPFGIALKTAPDRIIGTVGCFWVSRDAKSMELAYALDEQHWNKGLVPEACGEVMEYCFDHFGLKRIQARCKPENTASARVMQKIGMTYEGTLKASIFHRNRYWDMCYYAVIRD